MKILHPQRILDWKQIKEVEADYEQKIQLAKQSISSSMDRNKYGEYHDTLWDNLRALFNKYREKYRAWDSVSITMDNDLKMGLRSDSSLPNNGL